MAKIKLQPIVNNFSGPRVIDSTVVHKMVRTIAWDLGIIALDGDWADSVPSNVSFVDYHQPTVQNADVDFMLKCAALAVSDGETELDHEMKTCQYYAVAFFYMAFGVPVPVSMLDPLLSLIRNEIIVVRDGQTKWQRPQDRLKSLECFAAQAKYSRPLSVHVTGEFELRGILYQ